MTMSIVLTGVRTMLGDRNAPAHVRLARFVSVAVVVGLGTATVVLALAERPMGDLRVYLAAADRLAAGQPLYPSSDEPFNQYWYSPWLAAAFIPLTLLPSSVVEIAWLVILLAASAWVFVLLARLGPSGTLVAALVVPLLVGVAAGGNVQPLIVLALLLRSTRTDGPVWVGLAASLKIVPILFVVVYLTERRWRAALVAMAVSAVLWAPALPLGYTIDSLGSWDRFAPSLFGISPIAYVLVVSLAVASIAVVGARYRWLAASTAAVLALPRLFAYDVTLIGCGAVGAASGRLREPDVPRSPRS